MSQYRIAQDPVDKSGFWYVWKDGEKVFRNQARSKCEERLAILRKFSKYHEAAAHGIKVARKRLRSDLQLKRSYAETEYDE